MRRILVWDLPTRLFHWLLAAGFLAAAAIAFLLDDDHQAYPLHMLIGLGLALLVLFRIAWGVLGTRHARFADFVRGPAAVARYLRGLAGAAPDRHIGHNPASAYAILLMLVGVLGLAATGVAMARGQRQVKELHELLAYAMLAVVAAHVVGVVLHSLRHRENITRSMIDGRKLVPEAEASQAIGSGRPIVALLLLAALAFWMGGLVRSYDSTTRRATLPLLGVPLDLGGGEGGERGDRRGGREHDEDD